MTELSEYLPLSTEMTSYYLDLTSAGAKIDEPGSVDSDDFIEIECTEGIQHKRFFAVLGPADSYCLEQEATSLKNV